MYRHAGDHTVPIKEHALWCDYTEVIKRNPENCSQKSLQVAVSTRELTVQLLLLSCLCFPKIPDSKQIMDSSQLFVELFLLLQLQTLLSNCVF